MPGPSDVLLEHLPLIEQIIVSICRRKGMSPEETEEFSSVVKLRLIENDHSIIRAFKERSSFGTYMAAVVARLLLDYRNHEWGKWRPSAEARRAGEPAMLLEKLLYRDRRSFDEAVAAAMAAYPTLSRSEVENLAINVPQRVRRRRADLEEASLEVVPSDSATTERNETAAIVSHAVCGFIDQLEDDDKVLLRLRFDSELTVMEIARSMRTDPALLYRRLYQLFAELREHLQNAGVSAQDVADLIGNTENLDFQFKNREARPSDQTRKQWRPGRRKARHDR